MNAQSPAGAGFSDEIADVFAELPAMEEFAKESAPYAAKNPRIKALEGFADWDKGRMSESAGNKGDAIEAYERALQFGNFWQFRYQRGAYNSRSDQNEEALEDFNSAVAQYPRTRHSERHARRHHRARSRC